MIHHPVFLPICIFAPLIPSYHPFSIFWKQKNKSRIIAAKREPTPQKGCRFGPDSSRLSPWFHPIFWYHLWQLCFRKCIPGTNLQPWKEVGIFTTCPEKDSARRFPVMTHLEIPKDFVVLRSCWDQPLDLRGLGLGSRKHDRMFFLTWRPAGGPSTN